MGLVITSQYIDIKEETVIDEATNQTIILKNLTYAQLPYIERPIVEESTSFLYILSAILIGTLLVLLLIKYKKANIWRIWFFLAVFICLTVAFGAFVPARIAVLVGLVLAVLKVFRPSVVTHNFTEMFVYGGLAAIFVPIMNLFAVFMLLILISIYDMYAVWKSKHMVKLAKFVSDSKLFAGLSIPYKKPKKVKGKAKGVLKKGKVRVAILGGGDIGFPLMFSGVVMKGLILENFALGFLKSLIIPIFTTLALLWLLIHSQKDKFYPAMPFLSAGCFIGYGVVLLVGLFF
jgi:presenilin-like A22 family membrane protease